MRLATAAHPYRKGKDRRIETETEDHTEVTVVILHRGANEIDRIQGVLFAHRARTIRPHPIVRASHPIEVDVRENRRATEGAGDHKLRSLRVNEASAPLASG